VEGKMWEGRVKYLHYTTHFKYYSKRWRWDNSQYRNWLWAALNLLSIGTHASFPGGKARHKADHSSPTNVKIKRIYFFMI
jgi:hypothetical protein